DDVGTGDQRRIAGEAATVNHRNHRHQARQLRKGGECPGVDCYPRTSMIVAGPATSSLAKEYKRQTEAVTELEDAILLIVVAATLCAGKHRIVIVDQRRTRPRFVKEVAINRAGAGDDAVAWRVPPQLLHRVALVLARHDQRPVFVERTRIDQACDVFAR